jgi:hypothetical protein
MLSVGLGYHTRYLRKIMNTLISYWFYVHQYLRSRGCSSYDLFYCQLSPQRWLELTIMPWLPRPQSTGAPHSLLLHLRSLQARMIKFFFGPTFHHFHSLTVFDNCTLSAQPLWFRSINIRIKFFSSVSFSHD